MLGKVICCLLFACFGVLCAPKLLAQSQSSTSSRPKLKNFGKSLKQLKWDPKTGSGRNEPATTSSKSDSDIDVVRVHTNLVLSNFLVVDRQGRTVTGLNQSDFIVTEDDEVQDVSVFALGDSKIVPRSIVLIIDYSGSQLPYLETSVAAAKVLVDKLGPLDSMALVTDDIELILDFTSDKKRLKEKLDSLVKNSKSGKTLFIFRPGKYGRSQQYSALMATLNEAFTEEDVRPIVILQTDGDEIGRLRNSDLFEYFPAPAMPSNLTKEEQEKLRQQIRANTEPTEFSIEDVYHTVEESRATIYTVISGVNFRGLTPLEQKNQFWKAQNLTAAAWAANSPNPGRTRATVDRRVKQLSEEQILERATRACKMQEALAKVAALSGGLTASLESPDQAEAIYSRILADMNQRYVVGYYPSNKERDGKRRRVKIEVRGHPDYGVVGRKAYYAPVSN